MSSDDANRAQHGPPLPEPESEELRAVVGSAPLRLLYGLLYRRRENPPTAVEARLFMNTALGDDDVQFDRRLRELRDYFEVAAVRTSHEERYSLRGWVKTPEAGDETMISLRVRAQVLAPQRCAQCGRTPLEHGVVLVVDLKVPRAWGGSNDPENLQPLCEECSAGKRDYFSTFEPYANKLRRAINHDQPQKRIGELLKAFEGDWVRTDLLSIVASAKQYQEDWQRRLRDLRILGWDVESQRRHHEGARVWTYYRVARWLPWPPNIREALNAEEQRRRRARRDRNAGSGH